MRERLSLEDFALDLTEDGEMLTHCAPIFFLPSSRPVPADIYANGTAALLDTGIKRVLVTCEHVWSDFKAYREEMPEARLAVIFRHGYALPIWIEDSFLIDSDRDLDLVVFDAEFGDEMLGFKRFYRIPRFPLADPKPDQLISFVGFPGASRRVSQSTGQFKYSSFGLTVTDVSHTRILLASTPDRFNYDNEDQVVPHIDLGGMSGAPAYGRTRGLGFDLAGFVQMGRNSGSDIYLSKASFLQRDGTIRRS
jgi:hypothetical protein